MLILNLVKAQVPQGFKYQTAIRDNNGAVLANKLVAIKLSLLAGSATGTLIYSEVHKVATNDFGVANLNVGNGTVGSGNFSTIDWGSNTFFLKTEIDVNNGTNFIFMGTSQLLSVPFAMYAAKSANAANDKDQDSTNEIQNINLNNNTLQLSKNGGSVDLTKYDKDSQQLVLNGNTLSITKGNSIVLSGAVDLDADPTNEIQNLTLSNDSLKLSKSNYVILPKDNDADSTNEIQSLSVSQNKLSLSKSNQVNIDADTTNEIQSLSIVNDSLQLSKANKVAFPKDNDRDSLNELQMLSRSNDTIFLSKGNFVVLPKNIPDKQYSKSIFQSIVSTNFNLGKELSSNVSLGFADGYSISSDNIFDIDSAGSFIIGYNYKDSIKMKNNVFNLSGYNFIIAKFSKQGNLIWTKNFGTGIGGRNYIYSLKIDSASNLGIITGIIGGNLSLGTTIFNNNPFIAAIELTNGNIVWSFITNNIYHQPSILNNRVTYFTNPSGNSNRSIVSRLLSNGSIVVNEVITLTNPPSNVQWFNTSITESLNHYYLLYTFTNNEKYLACIRKSDFSTKWDINLPQSPYIGTNTSIMFYNNYIYATFYDNSLKIDTNGIIIVNKKMKFPLNRSFPKIIDNKIYIPQEIPINLIADDTILNPNSVTSEIGYLIYDLNLNYLDYFGIKNYGSFGYPLIACRSNEIYLLVNFKEDIFLNNSKNESGFYLIRK